MISDELARRGAERARVKERHEREIAAHEAMLAAPVLAASSPDVRAT